MGNRFRQRRRILSASLAAWLTVLSSGVSISHAHAAGHQPHAHGYGWNLAFEHAMPTGAAPSPLGLLLSAPPLRTAVRPGDSLCLPSAEAHRHFVLLGIELPAEDGLPPVAADPHATHVQAAIGPDCERGPTGLTDHHLLAARPLLPLRLARETCPRLRPPTPSAPLSLTAFARREVSGVLRP